MKLLIVCSYRDYSSHTNYISPFIFEQVISLEEFGYDVRFVYVKGGGLNAYLKASSHIFRILKKWNPDIIHAHGGLCGFISNFQRKVPVVTTFHGTEINNSKLRLIINFTKRFSSYTIFVSQKLLDLAKPSKNFKVIPCGVDTNALFPMSKKDSRELLGWDIKKTYILFSKAFFVKVKNYPLAKKAVDQIPDAELIELHGYNREQVNLLFNACDLALMTSFSEGSPQFIKEALACDCPIVSTDVGDVGDVIGDTEGCYISSFEVNDVVEKINMCLKKQHIKNETRHRILGNYDLPTIAKKIKNIYDQLY